MSFLLIYQQEKNNTTNTEYPFQELPAELLDTFVI
jgi:hypothetical protein